MKKNLARLFLVIVFIFVLPALAVAAQPKLVSGTVQLLNDATGWLLIIVPISSGCLAGWHLWVKSISEGDHASAAAHGKAAKNVLIAGAIITSITGLVNIFLSYYQ